MRIQTFTAIVGSEACNASCPYCVSKMTPGYDLGKNLSEVNWRNFRIGCRFARDNNVGTMLLTGKGEPTLFPDRISVFLREAKPFEFPFIELQTNGIAIANEGSDKNTWHGELGTWYGEGLTTVAISVVHWKRERNQEIFGGDHFNLSNLINLLHAFKFSVRLTCIMAKGWIDSVGGIIEMARWAHERWVEQTTFIPVNAPQTYADQEPAKWVAEHALPADFSKFAKSFFDERATPLMELPHGAKVYDFEGQNVCLSNCLTPPVGEQIRQLIFFPDGHLRYDWQFPGAILL